MSHLSIYAQIFIQNTFCQSLTKVNRMEFHTVKKQLAKHHFPNIGKMVKIKKRPATNWTEHCDIAKIEL